MTKRKAELNEGIRADQKDVLTLMLTASDPQCVLRSNVFVVCGGFMGGGSDGVRVRVHRVTGRVGLIHPDSIT